MKHVNRSIIKNFKDAIDNVTKYNLINDIKKCKDVDEIRLVLNNHFESGDA